MTWTSPILELDSTNIYDAEPAPPPKPMFGQTEIVGMGIGLLVLAAAIAFAVVWRRRSTSVRPSAEDLRQRIAARSLPFSVCSECRIIIDMPTPISCPQCTRLDCCVWVDTEAERAIAVAAVGDP